MTVPYDQLDPECVSLVRALNNLKGIKTESCCCGHGKHPMVNWFSVENQLALFQIGRALDKRYSNHSFTCTLDIGDLEDGSVSFLLKSKAIGDRVFEAAESLAQDLSDPEFFEYMPDWEKLAPWIGFRGGV